MLGILKIKNSNYSGRDSYRQIEELIKKGQEIYIVSPYIDIYYANFIIKNFRGKTFYIIASSIEKDVARKLQRTGRWGFAKYIIMLLFLDFVLFDYYRVLSFLLLLFIVFVALLLFLINNRKDIHLKIPKEFVHAKMYISEGIAIRGSANLTYKGMHKNIEHVQRINNRDEIRGLRNEFWKIWESC